MADNLTWKELLVVGGVDEGGVDDLTLSRITQENMLKAPCNAADADLLSSDSVEMAILYCGLDGMAPVRPDELATRYHTTIQSVFDDVAFVFRVVRHAIKRAAEAELC